MSPWIVGFGVFFGYPLVMSVYLSFTHYDLLSSPKWIGWANYKYLFTQDPQVGPAVKNTLWLIAIMVPLQVLFAFGIAMMVARARRGAGFFRTVFYLPALAPPVAATMAFVYLLNPATGPVNTILGHLGIEGPLWFQSPQWSKPSLTLLSIWGVGNLMIIFLAAVLDAPQQLYESAELDGAGAFQRMRWVTLPTISPVILFSVVISVIAAMQYFTQAYVAANIASGQASQAGDQTVNNLGYPEDSTLFYPVLLYQHGRSGAVDRRHRVHDEHGEDRGADSNAEYRPLAFRDTAPVDDEVERIALLAHSAHQRLQAERGSVGRHVGWASV